MELPAWLAITEQVPVPLVMVYVAPELLHSPELVKVTGLPLAPPVAATVKLLLYAADDGGLVVNAIVWVAKVALTVLVTCGAAAYVALPAWFAITDSSIIAALR